jgi:hypothetical protein
VLADSLDDFDLERALTGVLIDLAVGVVFAPVIDDEDGPVGRL